MKKGTNTLADYKIFGSENRDTEGGNILIQEFLHEKQTPENLKKLAAAISIVWPHNEEKSALDVKLSLSKFQEKLEKNKQEISTYLDQERKKKRSSDNN